LWAQPPQSRDKDVRDGERFVAEWTVWGPLTKTMRPIDAKIDQLAVDPRGPTLFGRRGGELVRIDGNSSQALPLRLQLKPTDAADASEVTAIAFDTLRNRVVLTTKGGALGAYDVISQQATVLDKRAFPAEALAYGAEDDVIYAVSAPIGEPKVRVITRFNAHGAVLGQSAVLAVGPFAAPAARHLRPRIPLQAFCLDGHLIVIAEGANDPQDGQPPVRTLFVINPKTGDFCFHFPMQPQTGASTPPAQAQLAIIWDQLATPKDELADEPMRQLVCGGDDAARFLGDRLKQLKPVSFATLQKLIDQLEDDEFSQRERAMFELAALGNSIESQLELATRHPSPEVQRRAKVLLERCRQAGVNGGPKRELRAVVALRLIGTPTAIEALENAARTVDTSLPLARAAKVTLREIDGATP
jgi:hypothetical protein